MNIHVATDGKVSATGSAQDPYPNFVKANAAAKAGDTVIVRAGTYADAPNPAVSGTQEQRITYRAEGEVIVNAQSNLAGRKHITLDGFTYLSNMRGWIYSDKASGYLNVMRCTFDSKPFVSGITYHFVGVRLDGNYNRFTQNKVKTWYGGDAVQSHGDYALIEDCDWSQCRCGHGPLMHYGSYGVIRGSVIVNPWARAAEIIASASQGERNLIENLVIHDTNWDEKERVQGFQSSIPGDGQIVKTGGNGTIFRDITIRRSRFPNMPGNYEYASVLQMGNYGIVSVFKNLRFYDLLIEDNALTAFAIVYNPALPMDAGNNRIYNSVFRRNPRSFWLQGNAPGLDTLVLENNLFADPIKRGSDTLTIDQYQAKYPQAKNNSSTEVPKKRPLCTLTAPVFFNDIIIVDDAYTLSDGNGLVPGDQLMLADQRVQVAKWIDSRTVQLTGDVEAKAGDPVWRLADYVAPPVVEPEPIPEPELDLPVVVEPEPEPAPLHVDITLHIEIRGTTVTATVVSQDGEE